jgi:DNA-binding transcriptional LysR family regulator
MRRLSDVDLRLLRIFSTIVDCNGFRNAQIALNMAQSTLSSHLSTLEARLGSRLCERGRGGFRLTLEGEETYRAAQDLFRSIEGFGARMKRVHGREEARLRLGVIDTVASFAALALPRAIAAFSASHPQVFIDFEVMQPEQLQRAVVEGRRDVVIGPAFQAGSSLSYRDLAIEEHLLYCGRLHPWFGRDDATITLADFHEIRLAVRAYQYFDDTYKLGGVRAGASVTSMEAQEILILSGAFAGFLPVHQSEPHVQKGEMRPVRPREWGLRSRFTAAYAPDTGAQQLKAEFIECLLSAIRTRSGATL